MRDVRFDAPGAGSRCSGYMVQFGAVAVFDARMAGEYGRLPDLLSNDTADHGLRHPVFLGGAGDNARDSFHWQSSLPRGLSAFAGAHGERGKNVQVQGDGT